MFCEDMAAGAPRGALRCFPCRNRGCSHARCLDLRVPPELLRTEHVHSGCLQLRRVSGWRLQAVLLKRVLGGDPTKRWQGQLTGSAPRF